MSRINSRTKGKTGELEIVKILREHGFEARRGQQYSGSPDSPDVVVDLGKIHLEVKRTERFELRKALAQAQRDAGEDKVPVVVQRGNRQPWVVVMLMEDFLNMLTDMLRAGAR